MVAPLCPTTVLEIFHNFESKELHAHGGSRSPGKTSRKGWCLSQTYKMLVVVILRRFSTSRCALSVLLYLVKKLNLATVRELRISQKFFKAMATFPFGFAWSSTFRVRILLNLARGSSVPHRAPASSGHIQNEIFSEKQKTYEDPLFFKRLSLFVFYPVELSSLQFQINGTPCWVFK